MPLWDTWQSRVNQESRRLLPSNISDTNRRCSNITQELEQSTEDLWKCHDASDQLAGTELSKLYLLRNDHDPWAQDFVEPSYVSMPGPVGPVSLRVHIRSSQDSRASGSQVFTSLRDNGIGAVHRSGGVSDEINSMLNLECTPPFTHNGVTWPAGRIIMGRHGPYEPQIIPYLRAQEVQDPILLDAAWLWVGHVDEFVQFLPVESQRRWDVVVAGPEAGLRILQDAQQAGHGHAPMYSRKTDIPNNVVTEENCIETTLKCLSKPAPEKTIGEYLADTTVVKTNIEASKRIAGNIDILKSHTGITDDEVHRLPMLFNNLNRDERSFIGPRVPDENLAVVAACPGIINGVILSGFITYLAPNPWGPLIEGQDVMAEVMKKFYEELGWKVKFLDNWNSHHSWGAEVHCATNTRGEMNRRWWS
jgi:protein-arginine deiminase